MKRQDSIPIATRKGNAPVIERLKLFNEREQFAVLSTIGSGTGSYASLISFVISEDLKYVVFATPKNTRKYDNIRHSDRVSILIDNRCETKGNILETEALTIVGRAMAVRKGNQWTTLAEAFLKKHPALDDFVRSPSTALIKMTIEECVHVGQFQTVSTWDCGGTGEGERHMPSR
jgi:heme iron utilization protein